MITIVLLNGDVYQLENANYIDTTEDSARYYDNVSKDNLIATVTSSGVLTLSSAAEFFKMSSTIINAYGFIANLNKMPHSIVMELKRKIEKYNVDTKTWQQ